MPVIKIKKEEPIYKLDDKHHEFAKEICKQNITKRYLRKGCKYCDLKGYTGINEHNEIIFCNHCVNLFALTQEWIEYSKKNKLVHYIKEGEKDE